jgi:hypothetical protein
MPLVGIGTLPIPTHFSPASVPLPPETGGRGHTSLRVGGWGGGVPIPTRGIHCGILYMLCPTSTLFCKINKTDANQKMTFEFFTTKFHRAR